MEPINLEVVIKSSKPPKEIEFYSPPQEVLYHGTGKNLQRNIFKAQKFDSREIEKIKRLKEMITKQKFSIPSDWDDSDLLKFIYGANFKTRNAFKALKSCLESKTEVLGKNFLLLYGKIYEILKLGPLYMHGRDCHFRPLLVMNFTKFDLKKFPLENYLQAACFMLEFAACNMLYPGKVENWMCISDIGYRGLTDLPLNTLRKITKYLQDIFKCRVAYSSMINTPKTIYFIYSCLKPFLDPVTIEKISIEKGSVPIKLLKFFNPYQVEQKYGGKAPNLEVFWPPVFPNFPVSVDGIPEPIVIEEQLPENVEYLRSQEINMKDEHSADEVFIEEQNIEEPEEIKSKSKKRKNKKKRKSKESRIKRRFSKSMEMDELQNFVVSELTERDYEKVMRKPQLNEIEQNFIHEIQEEEEVNIEQVSEIIIETNSTTSFCSSNCQIY